MAQNSQLTLQELRFLRLASHGYRRCDIADVTGLSEFTIRNAGVRTRAKLNARSTTEAVAIAIRSGLMK